LTVANIFIYLLIKNYVSLFPGGSTRKVTTVADSGRRTDYSNCKAVTKKRNHYCKNESHANNLRVGPFVFKNCNKKIPYCKKIFVYCNFIFELDRCKVS